MPIPESHLKERLSVAYVKTVSAKAGAQYMTPDGAEYGTDGSISRVTILPDGSFSNTGWTFHCQLKATINWIEQEDHIAYDMDPDAYNKLVTWEGNSPCLLILLRLPSNEQEWLNLDEESLILKNCCYYKHLIGSRTDNTSSIRIRIPRNQLFTPEAVNFLLDHMKQNQGDLPNEH